MVTGRSHAMLNDSSRGPRRRRRASKLPYRQPRPGRSIGCHDHRSEDGGFEACRLAKRPVQAPASGWALWVGTVLGGPGELGAWVSGSRGPERAPVAGTESWDDSEAL